MGASGGGRGAAGKGLSGGAGKGLSGAAGNGLSGAAGGKRGEGGKGGADATSIEDIRALYELRVRQEPKYPGALIEKGPHTVRLIEGSRAWLSWSDFGGLAEEEVDAAIESEIARFRELGLLGDLEWKLFGRDKPGDLRERLAARGFVPKDPADAILVLDLSDLPSELRSGAGHDLRRLKGRAAFDAMWQVVTEVWPEDADDTMRFVEESLAADPEGQSLWIAFADGRPVAEGRVEFACGEFAGLWGGATLPAYRQRGIYTALVAARAAEAIERGCRFLTIDASPMSRAVLEKRGFRFLDTALECNYLGS